MMYGADYLRDCFPHEFNNQKWPERGYWGAILSPIQPTPVGTIDFSFVTRISDAYHIDRMGYGGHFVCFDIYSRESLHFEYAVCSTFVDSTDHPRYGYLVSVRECSFSGQKHYTGYDVPMELEFLNTKGIQPLIRLWEDVKMTQLKFKQ